MTILRLSKSKLLDFKKCPRKYYLKNFTPFGRQNNESKPDYMVLGTVVHEFIEKFNKQEDDVKYLQTYLFKDEDIRMHILNFYQILQNFNLQYPLHAELKIEDSNRDLVGIVDAIYEYEGEKGVGNAVIDYKTGKFNPKYKSDSEFELYIYALLVEENLGITVDYIGMFFTKNPKCMTKDEDNTGWSFIEPINRRKLKRVEGELNKIRDKILDGEFPRKESKLCGWCDFVQMCEVYNDPVLSGE